MEIIIHNEIAEITNQGMFMGLNKYFWIKTVDVIKIGNTLFRILSQNFRVFTKYGDRQTQEDKYCILI